MNLQGHRNDAGESRPVSLPLVYLDSAGMWFSCQAIIFGFQFLQGCSRFLQIRSQLCMRTNGRTGKGEVL